MSMMRVDLVLCTENAFKNGEFVYLCDPMEQYYFLCLSMFWTCAKWFCSLECDKCLASDFLCC